MENQGMVRFTVVKRGQSDRETLVLFSTEDGTAVGEWRSEFPPFIFNKSTTISPHHLCTSIIASMQGMKVPSRVLNFTSPSPSI
jgi:hypothetical protein